MPPGKAKSRKPSARGGEYKKVTKKLLEKRRTRGYESESDTEAEGYLKLDHKNRVEEDPEVRQKAIQRRLDRNLAVDVESSDEEIAIGATGRDAWGKEAEGYYDDDIASDSDDNADALELQLEEARQLRRARMAALTKEDIELSMDLYASAKKSAGTEEGATGELLGLDMLLAGLIETGSKIPKAEEEQTEIADAAINLAAQFLVWKERCQEESCPYLVYQELLTQLGKNETLVINPAVKTYLQAQLTVTVWLGLVLHSVGIYGNSKVEVFGHAKTVARALSKLTKLRNRMGGDRMFALLHEELLKTNEKLRAELQARRVNVSESESEGSEDEFSVEDSEAEVQEVESDDTSTSVGSPTKSESRPVNRVAAARLAALKVAEAEERKQEEQRLQEMERIREALGGKKRKGKKEQEPEPQLEGEGSTESESEPEPMEEESVTPPRTKTSGKKREEIAAARKELMREEIVKSLPALPRENEEDGTRGLTRQIQKNRGLVRKRKRTLRHARLHYREKYQKRLRSMTGTTMKAGEAEVEGYSGEATGISTHVIRSRTIQ